MQKLIIIDTFGFFFRNFFALPPLRNKDGFPTGLLMGFANLIMKLHKNNEGDFVVFALEGEGVNKRKEFYANYKANRAKAPEDLILQLPIAIEWIEKMGFVNLSIRGYEADDVIASLATLAERKGLHTQIISHDKDLYQLINEHIYLLDPVKNKEIHEEECFEKFGVYPKNFIDYQSLVGDSSDNVPGIKGIGAKTASKLIERFETLENIYENTESIAQIVGERLAGVIKDSKDSAFLSKRLVSLERGLFSEFDFSKSLMPPKNPLSKILDEMKKYEFAKIVQRLSNENPSVSFSQIIAQDNANNGVLSDAKNGLSKKGLAKKGLGGVEVESSPKIHTINDGQTGQIQAPNVDFGIFGYVRESSLESTINENLATSPFHFKATKIQSFAELENILDSIPQDCLIAYDCETTALDTKEANIVGFSFCADGVNAYYVPIAHSYLGVESQLSIDEAKKAIQKIFAHSLIGHNLKYDLKIAQNLGINYDYKNGRIYDSMVLAWLFDSVSKVGLDEQMKKWFNYLMISFGEVLGKLDDFSQVPIPNATKYAAEDAAASFRLFFRLKAELDSRGLSHIFDLAQNVEFPFIKVLLAMEEEGIAIDEVHFRDLQERFAKEIAHIEQEIFSLCGSVFNLNSPKQLASMLFDTLKLKAQRQIKGGYSTDEKTLQTLLDAHPAIPKILEYRELAKLKGTYVEPMLKLQKNHKIYTSFLQTGTATGRLSSKSPNLQNIPVRSEQGRLIRAGFCASDDSKILLSIDYSQIELRLLAHFSKDPVLLEAFANDLDIHLQTAKIIFGESSAEQKRNVAKSINFGLIYGMGATKLSQTLKIPLKEAKSYIQGYFLSFPTVKDFLKSKEEEILQKGYAETLLGHRRYFSFSNATEFMRANFLREGINSIFQGSAADIIKLAMLKIHTLLQEKHSGVKMLLQVHDELIFELDREGAEQKAKELTNIMDNIYTLNVPLKSSYALGRTWAELK
ncbi:DNA polymerase I [Helicobacter sp. T3_23-1056]